METITIIKTVDEQTSTALPELKDMLGEEVEIVVRKRAAEPTKTRRRGGWLKGRLWTSPDFDEPLEDFKDYM